jgi:putative hydrolase of the HAD superfamily
MAIKAIFFDAAGTLIRPIRPVGETYTRFAAEYGLRVSAAEISQRFRTCFRSAPPLAFPGVPGDQIHTRERDWWKRLVQNVFEPWGAFAGFEAYFAELFNYFAQPESWKVYPEVPQTLAGFNARGLSLAVISNFDCRLHAILDGLGLARYFSAILVSSHVGYAKPSQEIFYAALDRYGFGPESALHVGDSEENDFEGSACRPKRSG